MEDGMIFKFVLDGQMYDLPVQEKPKKRVTLVEQVDILQREMEEMQKKVATLEHCLEIALQVLDVSLGDIRDIKNELGEIE